MHCLSTEYQDCNCRLLLTTVPCSLQPSKNLQLGLFIFLNCQKIFWITCWVCFHLYFWYQMQFFVWILNSSCVLRLDGLYKWTMKGQHCHTVKKNISIKSIFQLKLEHIWHSKHSPTLNHCFSAKFMMHSPFHAPGNTACTRNKNPEYVSVFLCIRLGVWGIQ